MNSKSNRRKVPPHPPRHKGNSQHGVSRRAAPTPRPREPRQTGEDRRVDTRTGRSGPAIVHGLAVQPSPYDVPTTVDRIVREADAHGARVFAVIDHAAAAESAGLHLPPTTVIVFGNPAVGTPLMVATPNLALDLPSRVLVRQAGAHVEVVYTPAVMIAARYGITSADAAGLAGLEGIVDAALTASDAR